MGDQGPRADVGRGVLPAGVGEVGDDEGAAEAGGRRRGGGGRGRRQRRVGDAQLGRPLEERLHRRRPPGPLLGPWVYIHPRPTL